MSKGQNVFKGTVVSVGLILLLTGCSTPTLSTALASSAEGTLKVVEAKTQSASGDVNVTGIFDTEDKFIITSQIPGKVLNVQVKDGMLVHKGDVLIDLEESEFQTAMTKASLGVKQAQASVDQAKIALDTAQKNLERVQELYNAGASALKDLEQVTIVRDTAKIAYETALHVALPLAEQNVTTAQQALAKTQILSPTEGIVVSLSVNPGDNVNPGVSLMTVMSNEKFVLIGNVSERVINNLRVDQEVSVSMDSVQGITLKGRVSYISPVSIPTGRFFPIKIALDNSSPYLKPGMTGNALIHVEDSNSIAVPSSAVIRRDGRNFVYVVKDGKAVKNPVQIGIQGEKLTVIQQGVKHGEWVVVDGNQNVYEGMSAEKLVKGEVE